jgi:hypothetical protein
MIQLEDAESVVRDHLESLPYQPKGPNDDQDTTAHHANSHAMTTENPHPTSNIDIKIVDLGVGMSGAEMIVLKMNVVANLGWNLKRLGWTIT